MYGISKAFLEYLCECVANAVSLISNILATFLREAYPHIGHVSSMTNIVVIVLRLTNDHYGAHFWVGLSAIRHIRHNGTAHVTSLLSGVHFWLVCRRIVWHVQDMNQI